MQTKYVSPWIKSLICGSTLVLTIGVILVLCWPSILKGVIEFGLVMKQDSMAYKLWQKNPMPLYLDFHLFNWTNPHEVHNSSIKPRFTEIGPIRFVEVKEKVNITWNNNHTVSFRHKKTWKFDSNYSAYDLDTKITTINPVTLSAAYVARHWGFFYKKGLQFTMNQVSPNIHITKTIGELLFEGYSDVLITLGSYFPQEGSPGYDKFAWFYARNTSEFAEGHYNMDTTSEGFGKLRRWNFNESTPAYSGKCGRFEGSAGELFPPYQTKSNISFFSSDVCRSLMLDFEEESFVENILGYKYVASHNFLDNGSLVAENSCYFAGENIPYGVLNVSHCTYDTPGFVSLPHFYKADPYYTDKVEGMKPNKDIHDFYITLEPTTGVPLAVAARLQLNLLLQPIQYITLFDDVPKVFFPVLWFEQVVVIPDHLIFLIKLLLHVPLMCQVLGYVFIVGSVSVLSFVLYSPVLHFVKLKPLCKCKSNVIHKEFEPLHKINGFVGNRDTKIDEEQTFLST